MLLGPPKRCSGCSAPAPLAKTLTLTQFSRSCPGADQLWGWPDCALKARPCFLARWGQGQGLELAQGADQVKALHRIKQAMRHECPGRCASQLDVFAIRHREQHAWEGVGELWKGAQDLVGLFLLQREAQVPGILRVNLACLAFDCGEGNLEQDAPNTVLANDG